MKILAIETSSERQMVALLEGTKLLGIRLFGQQSNPLMPHLEALLYELNWEASAIECIVVGVGPGSYTGMRIGAMVAKTLSFAKQIPLVGIPSLMAWTPQEKGAFAVVADAKIGGLYLLIGEVQEEGDVTYGESAVYPLQEALVKLKAAPRIITPHPMLIQRRLLAQVPPVDITQWQWHERDPNPEVMSHFAMQQVSHGLFSTNGDLTLLYLRKTQAEIEKER